jgi:hypothetical protein
MADWWEILAVRAPCAKDAQSRAEEDVEWVMAGVHDPGHCDAGGGQRRDQDDAGSPNFTLLVQNVEFGRQIQ